MKQLVIISILLATSLASIGQQDSTALTAVDSSKARSTLTLGLSIATNADYYGQRSQEAMPFAAALASWQHRSGFFVNAMSYRLLNNAGSGFASAYGAAVGFDFNMKKGWGAGVSYNYTYFPRHSSFLQAANPHTVSASVSREAWLTTKLEIDNTFGKTNDFFSTLSMNKAISLFSFSEKDQVILTPKVAITGGTQRFYSYYIQEKTIRDSLAGAILEPILGGDSRQDTTTRTATSFDLLSYSAILPLAYTRANYLLELSCQFSLLSNKTQTQPGKLNTFITASFYYQF